MADFQTQESPTPSPETVATPETEPTQNGNGTASPGGDAVAKGAPTEESFTRVDPKTLPPQLRQSYDQMLRDYKEKTGKVAEMTKTEVAKAVEAFKQDAEMFRQIKEQKEFVEKWNSYVQERNKAPDSVDGQNPDKLTALEKEVQQIRQEAIQTKTIQYIDAWSETKDEKGEMLRPDFNKLESIEIPGTDQNILHLAISMAPGKTLDEKLQNGYEAAKKLYDGIFEEGKKSTVTRMMQRVQRSSSAPSKSGPAGSYQFDSKNPPSAKEAREMAEKGIRLR